LESAPVGGDAAPTASAYKLLAAMPDWSVPEPFDFRGEFDHEPG